MPKIVVNARKLRLEYAHKAGRPVDQLEVAADTGMTEATLSKIERGIIRRIDFETLVKLCGFYSRALSREIGPGDILEYDPNNRAPGGQMASNLA